MLLNLKGNVQPNITEWLQKVREVSNKQFKCAYKKDKLINYVNSRPPNGDFLQAAPNDRSHSYPQYGQQPPNQAAGMMRHSAYAQP